MTETSRCGRFVDAILDEGAPRPDGLAAHVASCPDCRALAAAHRSARELSFRETASPPAVAEREILARVRRRRVVRVAGAGVAALTVTVALLWGPPRSSVSPGSQGDLFALADRVAELTRREPWTDEPTLGGLDAVSDWLAPPRARSLGFDSIMPPLAPRTAAGGDAP